MVSSHILCGVSGAFPGGVRAPGFWSWLHAGAQPQGGIDPELSGYDRPRRIRCEIPIGEVIEQQLAAPGPVIFGHQILQGLLKPTVCGSFIPGLLGQGTQLIHQPLQVRILPRLAKQRAGCDKNRRYYTCLKAKQVSCHD